ncbi:hypothetical protein CAOG_08009 [Capsaspora owczarzaki ATCC 30864]|uniref:Uncharacterized protein n=1 Tax=Capsaspora owczarzaki (strain ATCC 30864) TaxID=595528 RepID=A0A0D2W109_CAPO3|nr:hypothetical protein CAOG_08009 [Capsaspora owczarzaki ATCC 30864]KJE97942.1 hypothetical protein CAOG_008009 [Capsaspora owczarzaki ATCC 30864]|eukprot:XP_004342610.2 hypothetical protein CAOG_08009 [Capsaspora owczarzaki ATCC 30864]
MAAAPRLTAGGFGRLSDDEGGSPSTLPMGTISADIASSGTFASQAGIRAASEQQLQQRHDRQTPNQRFELNRNNNNNNNSNGDNWCGIQADPAQLQHHLRNGLVDPAGGGSGATAAGGLGRVPTWPNADSGCDDQPSPNHHSHSHNHHHHHHHHQHYSHRNHHEHHDRHAAERDARPIASQFATSQPLQLQKEHCRHAAAWASSGLRAGARFTGVQRCGTTGYNVSVTLKDVQLDKSSLCGYLTIEHLAQELPSLTTFFEAEIIGAEHSFMTGGRWGASEEVDLQHWARFPPFLVPRGTAKHADLQVQQHPWRQRQQQQPQGQQPGQQSAAFLQRSIITDPNYVHDFRNQDFVFMRWKEQFLVPDHRIKSVSGASFAGFYYICFQRSTSTISGLYYHQNSEWFQSLSMQYTPERTFGSFAFC